MRVDLGRLASARLLCDECEEREATGCYRVCYADKQGVLHEDDYSLCARCAEAVKAATVRQ